MRFEPKPDDTPLTPTGLQAVEELSAEFHNIYMAEARRQGDVRHKDLYADLPEKLRRGELERP